MCSMCFMVPSSSSSTVHRGTSVPGVGIGRAEPRVALKAFQGSVLGLVAEGTDRSEGERLLPDRPHDDERCIVRADVPVRSAADRLRAPPVHDPGVPLQVIQPELVELDPVEGRRDLRVPLEVHRQPADPVELRRLDLVLGERLGPEPVDLRGDRRHRGLEPARVHPRDDRPRPSGAEGPEAAQGVVRETLVLPDALAEPAVHPDHPEQEVREVEGVVVGVAAGDRLAADRDVRLGLVREEDEAEELPLRPVPRGVPLPPQVREDLRPHPLYLLGGEDRVREALRGDPEDLPRGAAGRPAPEHEEVLRGRELQGRSDPLEGLRDLAGGTGLRAAEEEAGQELRDPLLPGPLRGDPGGEAPLERDEGTRGVLEEQDATPALERDPLRAEAHGAASAWYRTEVRDRSTRYAPAIRCTSSSVTARTRSTNCGNVSRDPRTSSWPIMNPWAVTPSASYRFHARTSSRARSISIPLGGASRSFRTIPSSFRSRVSCSTPGIRVADTVRRDGSRRSC